MTTSSHPPPRHPWRRSVGFRLLLWILGASTAVTLLSTALQLGLDYRHDVAAIDQRIDEIERGSLDSIANSLWNVDVTNLKLQLDGILRLPDMQAVEVRETAAAMADPVVVVVGTRMDGAKISRQLPLIHAEDGRSQQIGTLYAEASLISVFRRLWERCVIILLTNGIKTFLISALILSIVHRAVTRHITAIATAFEDFDLRAPPAMLRLSGPRPVAGDELDQLAAAFNSLSAGLGQAYGELATANTDLAEARHVADARAARLAEVNEELQRLAMVTAHHLLEPVRPISINAQRILRHQAGLDPEIGAWCGEIVTGAVHLQALLRDLRLYVAALTEPVARTPVDVASVAEAARQAVLADYPGTAAITIDALPRLAADAKALGQVFRQLFSNAVLHRGRAAPVNVRVSARHLSAEWEFTIADDGPGIPAELGERVFRVFEIARGREPDRTGLGLPMCKAIIRAHGGRIWIAPGGDGATIRFGLGQI